MEEARVREFLKNGDLASPAPFRVFGDDPVFPAKFRVGEATAVAMGLAGAAAASLYAYRTGQQQSVTVDVGPAAATLVSHDYERVDGDPVPQPWWIVPVTNGMYQCSGGEWIYLQGQLEHLHLGILRLLGCEDSAESVREAVAAWDAFELEDALAERGLCGAVARTPEAWQTHPQGALLASKPLVEIVKIGEAEPGPLGDGSRPLSDVRVLEFARILAGPMTGRTLAEHGAEVLNVANEAQVDLFMTCLVTGRGKRSTFLNLNVPGEADRLRRLADDCRVFVNGFRSGALEAHGLGPDDLAERHPGIVYVSVNCYGNDGPWRERRGWEQLAQMVSGLALGQGEAGKPEIVPPGAPNDFITGILAAYGAMVALERQAREGGTWHVKASLSQTAGWILRNGRLDPGKPDGPRVGPELLQRSHGPLGETTHLAPPVRMGLTPPRWSCGSPVRGGDDPVWVGVDAVNHAPI